MKVLVHDLETQNHDWYGQIASPLNPDNYVVMDAGVSCYSAILGSIDAMVGSVDRRRRSTPHRIG